jgi:hypothetical protein
MAARLTIFLALASVTAAAAPAGAQPAEARAANYYAAGLERPLLEMRRGALLVQACADRLRGACSAQQREFAARGNVIELLDALTLFPQRPPDDPTLGITKAPQLARKIDETSAAMLRAANEYDGRLFARFGATLRVCPDAEATSYRQSIDDLIRIELTGLQGLGGEELEQAKAELARDEARIAEDLRRVPPEDCAAARVLGVYLMELMNAKLLSWSGEDRRVAKQEPAFEFGKAGKKQEEAPKPPNPEVARAVAGNFVTVVATELQLTVFPETAPRIKAIADSVEKSNAVQ